MDIKIFKKDYLVIKDTFRATLKFSNNNELLVQKQESTRNRSDGREAALKGDRFRIRFMNYSVCIISVLL